MAAPLSEHEAGAARKHLKALYAENNLEMIDNVWLIQLDGSSFISGEEHELFPIEEESVERGMLELNIFSGNAHYLDKHAPEMEAWLGDETELKIRFLKLRTARDERQNAILRRNPIINQLDQEAKATQGWQILQKRAEIEKNYRGRLRVDNPSDVKLLSPKKLRHLHVDEVRYLGIDWELREMDPYTAEAIKKLNNEGLSDDAVQKLAEQRTKEQFRALQPFQIPFLTKEQLKWIPDSKICFLANPEQICDLSQVERKYYLEREQAAHLTESQKHLIPFVNPDFYEDFTQAWQISAISPKDVALIPSNRWHWLSKPQVKHLPKDTSAIDLRLLQVPQKFGWIHGDLLESIPTEFLHKVCQEQIQEITNPELIRKLEIIAKTFDGAPPIKEGHWTSWISPEMVAHIDFDEQIPFLATAQQIGNIPDDQVIHLNAITQVPLIAKSAQIKRLEGEDQIQACPDHLTSELEGGQLNFISLKQVPLLRKPAQIQAITDPVRFACLTSEESLERKTVNQINYITDDQLVLLSKEQVKGLSNHKILTFINQYPVLWKGVRNGLTREQIATFSRQELIVSLSEEQIRSCLQKSQVAFLQEEWQIHACPDQLIRFLTWDQVRRIEQRQAQFLKGEHQIQAIRNQDVFNGLTTGQMKWIGNNQIEMAAPFQVPGLSPSQLLQKKQLAGDDGWQDFQSRLTPAQIALFDSQELIDLMSPEQITDHLEAGQVKFLKENWQIQACPDDLVKNLNEQQVRTLHAKEKMACLDQHQLLWIFPEQTDGLRIDQVMRLRELAGDENWPQYQVHLRRDQIEQFNSQEFINLLNAEQIANYLSEEQVPFLQSEWQIQACPDHLVRDLDPENQVPKILKSQVPFLDSKEQIQCCPCKKDWVVQFGKPHFKYLTDEQIALVSIEQIAQMDDIENEIDRLAASQLHAVNPGIVQNFTDSLVQKIQLNADAYPLIKRVSQNQVPLIRTPRAADHLCDEQIEAITTQQVSAFEPTHPLWGRINKDRIDELSLENIQHLPSGQLKHLTNQDQIREISFWKVKHLDRKQLKSRSWGQFLAYTVGVSVLGVAASIVALIAYASLTPFIILLVNREKGRYAISKLNTNPHRLYRYFEVYLSRSAA